MNIIAKTFIFLALSGLIGCSAARSKPDVQAAPPVAAAAEQPAPPAVTQLWIKVINLAGWVQAPDAEAGGFVLVNQAIEAQVQISTFTAEQGEPRDIVGWLMVQLAAQGAEIGEMTGEPGGKTARLTFSASVGARNISGVASAKMSSIDGIGFLVVGLCPTENEAKLMPDYEKMFESVDLSSEK